GLERGKAPHRVLAQHAGGLAGDVALDAPALGIGRGAGDARVHERRAVDPQRVYVASVEPHRALARDAADGAALGRLIPAVRIPPASHHRARAGPAHDVALEPR